VLLDGAQGAVHTKLDVQALGADFYAFSGHKMCGPTGIGVLWGRRGILDDMEPWQGGGEMIEFVERDMSTWAEVPHRFEAGTPDIAGAIGMGAAVDYALACGIEALRSRISLLAEYARTELAGIEGVRVRDRGGSAAARSGIVTFTLDGVPAAVVVNRIRDHGINVSLSTPDYARVDFETQGIEGLVRVSPHAYNTHDDITQLVETVSAIS